MPRQRNPNREKAKEMYLKSKGEIKLKDIAERLGVLDTQIRKWKNQDKWEQELKGTLPKIKRNVSNKKPQKSGSNGESIADEAKEVLENTELTDRQRLFCIYYIKYFNATKAYKKAYECDYNTAMVNGCNLLRNTKVKAEIAILKADKLKGAMLEPGDVLQKYIDIAFVDMNDFMEFGQKEVPMLNPITGAQMFDEDGNNLTYTVDYAHFKDSSEVDGTLISELSKGKDGAKIKLHDKMKALDWLANHMDLLDTATKEKLQLERDKFNAEQKKENGDGKDVVIKVTLEDDET